MTTDTYTARSTAAAMAPTSRRHEPDEKDLPRRRRAVPAHVRVVKGFKATPLTEAVAEYRDHGIAGVLPRRSSALLRAEYEHPPGRLNRRRARRHSVPREHETGSLSRDP
jgi:hypothetical protein